ncbi:hypothetical protein ACIPSE_12030 [Streptomyces sp. NPDC090106]|uniref:hypothetical protein n=1 Tax=Streptomyces sp. NPDC090106 TaxID=3365946 RepID=UPI00382A91EF
MPHTDPYRLSDAPAGDAPDGVSRAALTRTLLWAVVVLGAVANTVLSYGDVPVAANLACGAVTLAAATALVVRALRGRR